MTAIDERAFYGCAKLATLIIDKGESDIVLGDSCLAPQKLITHRNIIYKNRSSSWNVSSKWSAFGDSLKYVVFGEECTNIGDSLFFYCHGLKSVHISTKVNTIGNYVFALCSGLESINIPSSVTSIGESAFDGCIGLTLINIPSSVTSIEAYTFRGCI